MGDSVADDIDYDSFVGANDIIAEAPIKEVVSEDDEDFGTGEDLFDDSYDEYDE